MVAKYKIAKPVALVSAKPKALLNQTEVTLSKLKSWGRKAPYTKSLILRGVGYSFFWVKNDMSAASIPANRAQLPSTHDISTYETVEDSIVFWRENQLNDFINARYLIVRTGHTKDLHQPIPKGIFIKALKKNKKLVVYGFDKGLVNNFVAKIVKYRKPNVYTGRGIRYKHIKVTRKAGKKDKQKGRAF